MAEPLDAGATTIVTIRQVVTAIITPMATFAFDSIPASSSGPDNQDSSIPSHEFDWNDAIPFFIVLGSLLAFVLVMYIAKNTECGLRIGDAIREHRRRCEVSLRREGSGRPAAEQPVPDQPDAIPLDALPPRAPSMPQPREPALTPIPSQGTQEEESPSQSIANPNNTPEEDGQTEDSRGSSASTLPPYSQAEGSRPLEHLSPPYEP
ncbi:hypothetical protein F4678DRAFT_467654 [Xylaria arbuscula]|nr:hypothetical protein F4678DRAFT_467654 [Xylaria arbuscula]